jgi:hypothetical protein
VLRPFVLHVELRSSFNHIQFVSFSILCSVLPTLAIAGVIIMTTQLLSLGLKKIRQPRVIAEVIGGIFLGQFLFCFF